MFQVVSTKQKTKLIPGERSQEANAREESHSVKKSSSAGGEPKSPNLPKVTPIRGRLNVIILKQRKIYYALRVSNSLGISRVHYSSAA